MGLNRRQQQVLRMLPRDRNGIPLEELIQKLGVSMRTGYYDIQAINSYLAAQAAGALDLASRRISTAHVDWSKVDAALGSLSCYLSARERQALILLQVSASSRRITISSLIEDLIVSRNTIISDIREIKQRMEPFGISLTSAQQTGYRLKGEERAIRELLWTGLQDLESSQSIAAVRSFLQNALIDKTQEEIDFFELCRCLVKQYETDLSTRCFLGESGLELMMIQLSWLRSLDGCVIEMGREEQAALISTLSYRSVQCSAIKLKQSGLILPDRELLYITSLLLGIKTTSFMAQKDEDEHVNRLAERLASNFERVSCLNYVDRELVCAQMSNHIRPLYYRIKYGLQANNPLMNDIKKVYPMTFEFTRRAAEETGLYNLSDNEVGYLTIYLTSGLDRKMLEEGDTSSEKALIIGADNNATMTLLHRQILDACGIALDFSFAEPRKVHRWELDRFALVLALTPVPEQLKTDNLVEADPFLGEQELRQIYKVLRKNRIISKYSGMIEEIIDIFRGSVPATDRSSLESDKLFFELFRYFNKMDYNFTERLPTPEEREGAISAVCQITEDMTWKEAVLAGCERICADTGSTTLVDRMRNLVNSTKLQWYRMAPDIVVVHCPMQGDARGCVRAQALTCSGGIAFPDHQDATAIICLTSIDRYSHWSTLYALYKGLACANQLPHASKDCELKGGDQHDDTP